MQVIVAALLYGASLMMLGCTGQLWSIVVSVDEKPQCQSPITDEIFVRYLLKAPQKPL